MTAAMPHVAARGQIEHRGSRIARLRAKAIAATGATGPRRLRAEVTCEALPGGPAWTKDPGLGRPGASGAPGGVDIDLVMPDLCGLFRTPAISTVGFAGVFAMGCGIFRTRVPLQKRRVRRIHLFAGCAAQKTITRRVILFAGARPRPSAGVGGELTGECKALCRSWWKIAISSISTIELTGLSAVGWGIFPHPGSQQPPSATRLRDLRQRRLPARPGAPRGRGGRLRRVGRSGLRSSFLGSVTC
jgi:hypothetical protein